MPYGMTHADIDEGGGVANMIHWDFAKMAQRLEADERGLGCGLAAYFVKGALDRGVELMTGTSAVEIYADGALVIGVRARKDGNARKRVVYGKSVSVRVVLGGRRLIKTIKSKINQHQT